VSVVVRPARRLPIAALSVALVCALPLVAQAAPTTAAVSPSEDLLGKPLGLVVALAVLSLLPFVLMTTTAFVKIATTLQIVKSAIGAQGVPSNTVVMALAASLSLLAMAPVVETINHRLTPVIEHGTKETSVFVKEVVEAVREPLRDFLDHNTAAREKVRFLRVARAARPEADRAWVTPRDFAVLVPAFVTTELAEAFLLGFAVYLPFLVIDLVVANVLLALGMQMLQPTQVSLPFKLLLFVGIDGWGLLAEALVAGYR
jgi:type III secretion protein R